MTDDKEAFLERWSRLKLEQGKVPPAPVEKKEEPPPALPPVDQLKPESDFRPFMDPRVDKATRRLALKKLFADAHFSTPDPFEPYSIDLTGEDPIPEAMLKTLEHAKRVLFEEEKSEAATAGAAEQAGEQAAPQASDTTDTRDVADRQDT